MVDLVLGRVAVDHSDEGVRRVAGVQSAENGPALRGDNHGAPVQGPLHPPPHAAGWIVPSHDCGNAHDGVRHLAVLLEPLLAVSLADAVGVFALRVGVVEQIPAHVRLLERAVVCGIQLTVQVYRPGADHYVPADAAPEGRAGGLDVLFLVGLGVDDPVESASPQLLDEAVGVVAVAGDVGDVVPPVGPGVAAGEHGDGVAALQQPLDDDAPHEPCAADHKDIHCALSSGRCDEP